MRLFVAFEVPPEVREALDRRTRQARNRLPKARWVRPEAVHLTLVFLGETDPERLPALHRELGAACAAGAPMALRVAGVGAFPPRGRRRVVWIGVETEGPIGDLQRRVAEAVERATGLEPERRPFHPHLTLARCRPPWPPAAVERLATGFGAEPAGAFTARRASLISSQLHPAGARYTTVETYPLGGAAEGEGVAP